MTRKEAIERLDLCQNVCNDCLTCASHDEALDMAIAALRAEEGVAKLSEFLQEKLREQEERSKGCEYCTDSKSIYEIKSPLHDSYNTDVYISENALVVDVGCHSYGAAGIEFCPKCGRRLEGGAV